jgi:hypothetical protein
MRCPAFWRPARPLDAFSLAGEEDPSVLYTPLAG